MILDFHATCGNAPTHGKDWSLDALARWADRCGIDALMVESADAAISPSSIRAARWASSSTRRSRRRIS